MIKRGRRGQIDISFGMIFSIILIIVVIAVAFYVIRFFLGISNCGEVGSFYKDLQDRVDKAYAGGKTQDVFEAGIPNGIEYVCFGELTQQSRTEDRVIIQSFKDNLLVENQNVFLYPTNKACDGNLAYNKIEHVKMQEFFCKKVESGKIGVKVAKTSTEALVTLSR